jgi:hypothetical protein
VKRSPPIAGPKQVRIPAVRIISIAEKYLNIMASLLFGGSDPSQKV